MKIYICQACGSPMRAVFVSDGSSCWDHKLKRERYRPDCYVGIVGTFDGRLPLESEYPPRGKQ